MMKISGTGKATLKAVLIAFVPGLLLAACAGNRMQADGSVSYTYSAFDFSGKAWQSQQQRCAPEGKKPRDLGTECGFWTCTSRLDCH